MTTGSPFPLPEEFNAASYFVDRHIAEGRGDKVAIECEDRRVTYRELFEQVNRVGNALRSLGVRPEERVFLLLLDTPEFASIFFGAIKIGAVPVPANTLLKAEDYEFLLNNSRARVAIVSASLFPLLQSIPPTQLRYVDKFVVLGHEASGSLPVRTPSTTSFTEWIRGQSTSLEAARTSKDDAAFWLYSSGSTGRPKACVHLQHDMVVCAEHYAKAILGISEHDRCFSVAKLFFCIRAGKRSLFPARCGRNQHPAPRLAEAPKRVRSCRALSPHAVLLRAVELREAAGQRIQC